MDKSIIFRFMSVLVALAAIAGIAVLAFNAGVAQGASSDLAVSQAQTGGTGVPYPGWHPWFSGLPFHGFDVLGVLFGLFLLFLVLRLMTFALWGPRWGYRSHMHGGWRRGWEDESGLPPMFREWHDHAHKPVEPDSKP